MSEENTMVNQTEWKGEPVNGDGEVHRRMQGPPPMQYQRPQAPPVPADTTDRLFAVWYLLIGYGFIQGMLYEGWMAGFTVVYELTVLGYAYMKKIKPPKESWFWLTVMLCGGIFWPFWTILDFVQILALIVIAGYWTFQIGGRMVKEHTSSWIGLDLIDTFFAVPFQNFLCLLLVFRKKKEGEKKKSNLPAILLGLVLAFPVLLVVLPLLSSADASFETLIANCGIYFTDHLMDLVIRTIFAVPVAFYLFGLIYGGLTGRYVPSYKEEELKKRQEGARILPDATVQTILIVICLVYGLFIGLQGSYFFSAFAGIRPENFTYAEYARRGFFELCAIAAINLALLAGSHWLSKNEKEKNKGLVICTILMSVLTLLLIATAMSKMLMYVSSYGLTQLRILTMVFMIWLILVFLMILWHQRKEIPLVRISVLCAGAFYGLLCAIPVSRCIDLYNIWAGKM